MYVLHHVYALEYHAMGGRMATNDLTGTWAAKLRFHDWTLFVWNLETAHLVGDWKRWLQSCVGSWRNCKPCLKKRVWASRWQSSFNKLAWVCLCISSFAQHVFFDGKWNFPRLLIRALGSRAFSQDFLGGRDVFERLYRDALRRMRTQAEVQARLAEEGTRDGMSFWQGCTTCYMLQGSSMSKQVLNYLEWLRS